MIQSVIGPLRGVYVAIFACPVGELGDRYLGYFKLYRERPRCYCDAGHFGHGMLRAPAASADAALHTAALEARQRIIDWPARTACPRPQDEPASSLARTSCMFCRSA